jgi:GT2 family glycosyltransferase
MAALAPQVTCIVLNWNGWRDTLPCLESLRAQTHPLRVVVVDNGSSDDSVARIREAAPWAELLETGVNLGYSGGNNVGIRHVLARNDIDFLWLLNNDTIAPPDTLKKLLATAAAQPEAGIVGTVLYYAHDPTRIQAWGGGRMSTALALTTHYCEPTVFGRSSYATFASVLVRCEVFAAIGLLYEGSFMYFDDTDFCARLHRTATHAGGAPWTIAVAADTAVLHKEGGSDEARHSLERERPPAESPRLAQAVTTAGLRFIRRHSPWAPLTMPLFVLLRLGNRLLRGRFTAARAVLRGVQEYRRTPTERNLFQA